MDRIPGKQGRGRGGARPQRGSGDEPSSREPQHLAARAFFFSFFRSEGFFGSIDRSQKQAREKETRLGGEECDEIGAKRGFTDLDRSNNEHGIGRSISFNLDGRFRRRTACGGYWTLRIWAG